MYMLVAASMAQTGVSANAGVGVTSMASGLARATPLDTMLLLRRSASARPIRYASRGPSATPPLLIAVKVPISTTGARANATLEKGRTWKRGYDFMTSGTMRSCINRVAVDCAPLMPSISGSITSSIFPSPGGTAAFENRSLAARSSASSNGTGVGGAGGLGAACGGGAAWVLGAGCGKAAVTPTRKQQAAPARRLNFRTGVVTRRLRVAASSDM